jgi:metal-responsive CopG/Arc/MetJ family transcriptional regulator
MRTTISIPDPTYEAAERLARQLGISRSELFTRAVAAFVQAHNDEITTQLNRVYAEVDSALDQDLMQLQVVSARCSFSDSW